jgi:hypothetical protein
MFFVVSLSSMKWRRGQGVRRNVKSMLLTLSLSPQGGARGCVFFRNPDHPVNPVKTGHNDVRLAVFWTGLTGFAVFFLRNPDHPVNPVKTGHNFGLSPQLPSAICHLPMKIVLDKIWRQADLAINWKDWYSKLTLPHFRRTLAAWQRNPLPP